MLTIRIGIHSLMQRVQGLDTATHNQRIRQGETIITAPQGRHSRRSAPSMRITEGDIAIVWVWEVDHSLSMKVRVNFYVKR